MPVSDVYVNEVDPAFKPDSCGALGCTIVTSTSGDDLIVVHHNDDPPLMWSYTKVPFFAFDIPVLAYYRHRERMPYLSLYTWHGDVLEWFAELHAASMGCPRDHDETGWLDV